MKFFNILSILMLLANQLIWSQSYDPILSYTKQWNVLEISSPPSGGDYYFTHSLKVVGDTILNNEHYYKIGITYSQNSPYQYSGFLMREDSSGKVWGARFIENSLQGQGLMYDFSINIGDTVNPYNYNNYNMTPLIVQNIDIVFFANKFRKRIGLSFSFSTDTVENWYEGIGSSNGLIYPGSFIWDYSVYLLAFYEDSAWVWINPVFNSIWVGTENVMQNESIKVYPNPASNILKIDNEEMANLEVLNLQGQIVESKMLIEKSNTLDLSNLISGVYTLRIKTDRSIVIRKLIKQ